MFSILRWETSFRERRARDRQRGTGRTLRQRGAQQTEGQGVLSTMSRPVKAPWPPPARVAPKDCAAGQDLACDEKMRRCLSATVDRERTQAQGNVLQYALRLRTTW